MKNGSKRRKRTFLKASIMSSLRTTLPKSPEWFQMAVNVYNDAQFREAFAIQRSTFDFIVNELKPVYERQNTGNVFGRKGGNRAIPFEKAVALTIYRFTTTLPVRKIAQKFGVGKSTVSKVVSEVTDLIVTHLQPRYIRWPSPAEQSVINARFEELRCIPGIVGAVDGTHIPIQLLKKTDSIDYYNRKGFYSIVLQAICDDQLYFRDVYVGWPGCCNDARVWRNSTIYEKAKREILLPVGERKIFAQDNFLLGDGGYSLNSFLMVPYTITPDMKFIKKLFNFAHSSSRMVIERAFGKLKNRFRLLAKNLNFSSYKMNNKVVVACCVLHNMCLKMGDDIYEDNPDPEPVFNSNMLVFGDDYANSHSKRSRIARRLLALFRIQPLFFRRRS
jgi:hypothetical protein